MVSEDFMISLYFLHLILLFLRINLEFGNGTITLRCNLTLSGTYESNVEHPALLGMPCNETITGNGKFNIDFCKFVEDNIFSVTANMMV